MRAMSIYIERSALNPYYYLSKQDTIELNLKNPINGNGIFFDNSVFISYFEEDEQTLKNNKVIIKNKINKSILDHHFSVDIQEKVNENNNIYKEVSIINKDFNSICDKEILLSIFIDNLTNNKEIMKVNDNTNAHIIIELQESIFSKKNLGDKIGKTKMKMNDKVLEPCHNSLQILSLIKPNEIITINHYIKKYNMNKKIVIAYN